MRRNETKAKLLAGEPVLGAFVNLPAPAYVEMLGWSGYDFVIVDAEHGPPSPETVENMVRAADASGITPIVRVAVNLQQNLLRYLDTGTLGVQIPMVNTAEEARAAAAAVRYPPLGTRGLAGTRASQYGTGQALGEYVRDANEQLLAIVQVETTVALDNLDAIVAVPGIDVVFIGPTDLSSSMGFPGETTRPEVTDAIEEAGRRIVRAGLVAGTLVSDAEQYHLRYEQGFRYLAGSTTSMLVRALRDFRDATRR